MDKRKRLVLLIGILVALVSFYVGLNMWISSKQENVQPLPTVVRPSPQPQIQQPPTQPPTQPEDKEDKKVVEKDLLAQKIQEEKGTTAAERKEKESEKPLDSAVKKEKQEERKAGERAVKTYTVQVGAFINKENALKALNKARSMGYSGTIREEDGFHKVLITVKTSDIRSEIKKLRVSFGGAIIK